MKFSTELNQALLISRLKAAKQQQHLQLIPTQAGQVDLRCSARNFAQCGSFSCQSVAEGGNFTAQALSKSFGSF